jgi:hypothetical protein
VLAPSSGIAFDSLVTARRFWLHRRYLNHNILNEYPPEINNLGNFKRERDNIREEFYRNPRAFVQETFEDYEDKVADILGVVRWRIIGCRFNQLMLYFLITVLVIMLWIFTVALKAKPNKDSSPTQSQVALTVIFNAAERPNMPTQTVFDCGSSEKPFKVGPFAAGEVVLEHDNTGVRALLDRLIASGDHRALIALMLIGSADKTPLLPELAQRYGSNAGLAQARAEWVKSQLLEADATHQLDLDGPAKIATLTAGPSQVGLTIPATDLALDRAVRVCAIWGTK